MNKPSRNSCPVFSQSIPSTSVNYILSTTASSSNSNIVIKSEKNYASASLKIKKPNTKKEKFQIKNTAERASSVPATKPTNVPRPISPVDIINNDHNYGTNNLFRNWFVDNDNHEQSSRCCEINKNNLKRNYDENLRYLKNNNRRAVSEAHSVKRYKIDKHSILQPFRNLFK